ncbi:hypothetical protein M9Y10_035242 [Tritrichomonas musculus]|uniref:Protein O-mannosyl-transferase C-terminal four TM domain-containing protein n=1 Tax=Tritrichomonas musculus TaxID=1915356 RepID=A0ABR2KI73_9EUKA
MMNYQPHNSMSRPKDWPLLRDVFVTFWKEGNSEIECIGNIFVYYFSFFGVFLILIYGIILLFAVFKEKSQNRFTNHMWIKAMRFFVGYLTSYLPFFLVPRTLYLCHYLISLMFAAMFFGASVDLFLPPFAKGIVCVVILVAIVFGFIFWSPLVYGTVLTNDEKKLRNWTDAWIHGNKGRDKWVKYMKVQFEMIKKQMNL